jgi:putative ABC transport system permease protein
LTVLLRLLRFPGLLLSVICAAVVLGVVSAASPVFLESAGGAILQRYVEQDQSRSPSVTISHNTVLVADVADYRDELLRRELDVRGLGAPVRTGRAALPIEAAAAAGSAQIRLVSRAGFRANVEVIAEAQSDGVWLADFTAADLGVQAEDEITLRSADRSVRVRVAGIYRDLLTQPRTPYWAPLEAYIHTAPASDVRPPAFVLVEWDSYVSLSERLDSIQDVVSWEFPIDAGPATMDERRAVLSGVDRFERELYDPSSQLWSAFERANFNEPLTGWLEQAAAVVSSINGPVEAISLGGLFLALAVMAGAGIFAHRRRKVEFALLEARGVSPMRVGATAALEAVVPVGIGASVGLASGWMLIRLFGPGGPIASPALTGAALRTAAFAAAGVLLFGLVAGLAVRTQSEERSHAIRRFATRVPWELILLLLAAAAFYELVTRGAAPVEGAGDVPQVDRLLLLVPILLIAGLAGLAVRALRRLLPGLRAWGTRSSTAVFLASRRLAAVPRLAVLLVLASAVAVGILMYAATLSSSILATASQHSFLAVGSDVAAVYSGPPPELAAAPFPATTVARVSGVEFIVGEEEDMDLLAIDPATFEEVAFWDSAFAKQALGDLVAGLRSEQVRVPVIVVGDVSIPQDPVLRVTSHDVPMTLVGTATTFPGRVGDRPIVVVDARALERALVAEDASLSTIADGEVWAKASEAELLSFLRTLRTTVVRSISAEELRATPRFLALRWMFRFLEALGVLAGVVVLIGALLYLQTRQRQGEASYALSRRMGLTNAAHRRSVALEVAGMLGAAFIIGTIVAILVALLLYGRIDVVSEAAGVAIFRLPLAHLAVTAPVLLFFSWAGAALVQRRAAGTDVAQVMRLAD